MEERRLKDRDVIDAADGGDQRRDLDGMVDVRRLVIALAPLVAMLGCRERECFQER